VSIIPEQQYWSHPSSTSSRIGAPPQQEAVSVVPLLVHMYYRVCVDHEEH
jgi:hypothetical protein